MPRKFRVLFLVSEVAPFAKTGGLADVAGALPKALEGLGHDVRIAMPLHRAVKREAFHVTPTAVSVSVPGAAGEREVRVWEALLPKSRVTTYFLECPPLYDRPELYQEQGRDYPDNLERFSVFVQAALRMLPRLGWQPELVHVHDWQAALACAHLARGPIGQEPAFASVGTVFTVHNLAYQGLFPKTQWSLTQLPESLFGIEGLEFYDQINCLKGGLVFADALTTVSPTYAQEIQTQEFGCGLDGLLRERRTMLTGIVNGIDLDEWNPAADPHLSAAYSPDAPAGKSLCKRVLQQSQRLPERRDLLIGMVQRLADQKGVDLVIQGIEELLALPVQIAILGTGDPTYHHQLERLAKQFPEQLAVTIGFNNALAHQIEAGADAFLMPSRFEPCGLNQLYSMRYGTIPVVRKVGGLADTVVDATPATRANQAATGFLFEEASSRALVDAVKRATAAFQNHALWSQLMQTGMRRDFSWTRSAEAYVGVYERALARASPSAARR